MQMKGLTGPHSWPFTWAKMILMEGQIECPACHETMIFMESTTQIIYINNWSFLYHTPCLPKDNLGQFKYLTKFYKKLVSLHNYRKVRKHLKEHLLISAHDKIAGLRS